MILKKSLGAALCLALPITFLACGPSSEEVAAEARAEAMAQLETAQAELEELRGDLEAAREEAAKEAEDLDLPEDADVEAALAEADAEAERLAGEVEEKANAFMASLVEFINEDPMIEGEEPSETQLKAIRMKSDEDIVLAMEYVDKGGDYARAADILEKSLSIDPDNEELAETLEEIKAMRFVTQERFDQVENGMTREQIRDILGQVNLRNIREFPDGRLGWFYRKDPEQGGGAAGVYFEEQRGEFVVYKKDYEAIEGNEAD